MQSLESFLKLSSRWVNYLKSQPETGMGYQIVSVILKDGRRFDQAAIILPYIGGVRGFDDIPFKEEEIDQIIVTHDKWDWSNETWNQR
jgi:hypothetical protein